MVVLTGLALAVSTAATATGVPSGQRALGQSVIEPVYDADHAGAIAFVSTPEHAAPAPDDHAVATLYLPVYPTGSSMTDTLCPHVPTERCPDHGATIASLAQETQPAVYGSGVIGHDHLMHLPRTPTFSVEVEPVVVLFTSSEAADEHLLTAAQVTAAVARGDAVTIPLPPARLHASVVPLAVWRLATPLG
jgi:hypothetical protein